MPHVGLPLPDRDAELIASCEGAQGALAAASFSPALKDWLEGSLQVFPQGAFLRLGGRSFVTASQAPRRIGSATDALALLCRPGDRAARMARRCLLAGRPVWLFVRAWRPMVPAQEIRLLIRQRALVAATQHHFRRCFPALLGRGEALAFALAEFADRLGPGLHLADVVADVWVDESPGSACELVELNPAMPVTGLGLLGAGPVESMARALHLLRPDGSVAQFALPV